MLHRLFTAFLLLSLSLSACTFSLLTPDMPEADTSDGPAIHSITVGEQELSYYESAGTGPTIVLIHGNSASGSSFMKQLTGDLGAKYHLIAMDLPGHGNSADAYSPEDVYSISGYAKIIADFAQAVEATDATFVGWSLGGHVLLEAVHLLPDAKGFVIYGTPPIANPPDLESAFLPNPAMGAAFNPELTAEEKAAFVTAFFRPGYGELPDSFMQDINRTHGIARSLMGASVGAGAYLDEIAIVGEMTQPLAILHGAEEQLVNSDYISTLDMPTLWRGSIQVIDGAGHAPHWEQPDAFSALIDAFVDEVN